MTRSTGPEQRALRWQRFAAASRAVNPRASAIAVDPIARSASRHVSGGLGFVFVAVAVLSHVAFAAAVGGASWVIALGHSAAVPVEQDPVAIEIFEPEPEPEPVPEEVEEVLPEPLEETPPEKPPAEKAPDPEPAVEPQPEEPPPGDEPPPLVAGLDLGSTVTGGAGPSFAVGNTLAGRTKTRAVDPEEVAPDPSRSNRRAAVVPSSGAQLVRPKRTRENKPEYPPELKAQGIEGNVVVEVDLNAEGRVVAVRVVGPSPYAEFNVNAQKAARQERWQPALRDGNPIPFTLSFPVRYRISD